MSGDIEKNNVKASPLNRVKERKVDDADANNSTNVDSADADDKGSTESEGSDEENQCPFFNELDSEFSEITPED